MKRMARGSYGYGHTYGYGGEQQPEDRLTSLSDDLLISILSHIDTKQAVQSSILSKRWVNLWTLLPVLNFTCEQDQNPPNPPDNDGYMFIHNVFARRNASILIEKLSANVSDHYTMFRLFNDALSLRVSDLRIDCSENIVKHYPISCVDSSDLLMSLSLKGMVEFGYFPRFDGLVKLRLERVKIVENEAFASFVNLEELFLVNCKMEVDSSGLEVVADKLWRLTISSCFHTPVAYPGLVLSTPNLVVFELEGLIPMEFEAVEELPALHTVHIDALFSYGAPELPFEQQKINLIKIIGSFKYAACVHLTPSTVEVLIYVYVLQGHSFCTGVHVWFLGRDEFNYKKGVVLVRDGTGPG
ncbi:putative leucine-rich repeat domain superfamily, F-box-like domain superfamily [Helianthus debilis subsp. tardiflorus]